MNPLLRDLYGHQEWADAEHWRAVDATTAAADDTALRVRLHHLHLVKRAFRWILGDRQGAVTLAKAGDFCGLGGLTAAAGAYHDEARRFLAGTPEERFDQRIDVPWFRDPPL